MTKKVETGKKESFEAGEQFLGYDSDKRLPEENLITEEQTRSSWETEIDEGLTVEEELVRFLSFKSPVKNVMAKQKKASDSHGTLRRVTYFDPKPKEIEPEEPKRGFRIAPIEEKLQDAGRRLDSLSEKEASKHIEAKPLETNKRARRATRVPSETREASPSRAEMSLEKAELLPSIENIKRKYPEKDRSRVWSGIFIDKEKDLQDVSQIVLEKAQKMKAEKGVDLDTSLYENLSGSLNNSS